MKILLDENFPIKLKYEFKGLNVYTVSELGWKGMKNSDLLMSMEQNEFDFFDTLDKNINISRILGDTKLKLYC